MSKWILTGLGVFLLATLIAIFLGRAREAAHLNHMVNLLADRGAVLSSEALSFKSRTASTG